MLLSFTIPLHKEINELIESQREKHKEGKKEVRLSEGEETLPLSLRRCHGIVIVLFVADNKGLLM